ncbi:MAG TPA: hypothetical protein VF172_03215 [Nitrososphaera sp.]
MAKIAAGSNRDQQSFILPAMTNPMVTKGKARYEKKETLGKRLVRNCFDVTRLRQLDVTIGFIYDANKAQLEKYQDRMNKLDELYHEYTENPRAFVEKYAKLDKNESVLKMLKDNPTLFDGLFWT